MCHNIYNLKLGLKEAAFEIKIKKRSGYTVSKEGTTVETSQFVYDKCECCGVIRSMVLYPMIP